MNDSEANQRAWCEKVAGLATDVLIDRAMLRREDFAVAASVIAEEVFVRLSIGDYPPAPDAPTPLAGA